MGEHKSEINIFNELDHSDSLFDMHNESEEAEERKEEDEMNQESVQDKTVKVNIVQLNNYKEQKSTANQTESSLTSKEKLYSLIKENVNDDGTWFTTTEDISGFLGVSRQTTYRGLRSLKYEGKVDYGTRKGNFGGTLIILPDQYDYKENGYDSYPKNHAQTLIDELFEEKYKGTIYSSEYKIFRQKELEHAKKFNKYLRGETRFTMKKSPYFKKKDWLEDIEDPEVRNRFFKAYLLAQIYNYMLNATIEYEIKKFKIYQNRAETKEQYDYCQRMIDNFSKLSSKYHYYSILPNDGFLATKTFTNFQRTAMAIDKNNIDPFDFMEVIFRTWVYIIEQTGTIKDISVPYSSVLNSDKAWKRYWQESNNYVTYRVSHNQDYIENGIFRNVDTNHAYRTILTYAYCIGYDNLKDSGRKLVERVFEDIKKELDGDFESETSYEVFENEGKVVSNPRPIIIRDYMERVKARMDEAELTDEQKDFMDYYLKRNLILFNKEKLRVTPLNIIINHEEFRLNNAMRWSESHKVEPGKVYSVFVNESSLTEDDKEQLKQDTRTVKDAFETAPFSQQDTIELISAICGFESDNLFIEKINGQGGLQEALQMPYLFSERRSYRTRHYTIDFEQLEQAYYDNFPAFEQARQNRVDHADMYSEYEENVPENIKQSDIDDQSGYESTLFAQAYANSAVNYSKSFKMG